MGVAGYPISGLLAHPHRLNAIVDSGAMAIAIVCTALNNTRQVSTSDWKRSLAF